VGAAVHSAADRCGQACRHVQGDRWFVDETDVKVNGRWVYLYRAIDQYGQVIDVLVSHKRDLETTPVLHPRSRSWHKPYRGEYRPGTGLSTSDLRVDPRFLLRHPSSTAIIPSKPIMGGRDRLGWPHRDGLKWLHQDEVSALL